MTDQLAVSVAEPREETVPHHRAEAESPPKHQPRYSVILHNDEEHTYEYVIAMMMELFAHTIAQGFQIAKEVDTQGRAVVMTTTREHAELKRDQIHAYGKDSSIENCQGSMWATVEPVQSEG